MKLKSRWARFLIANLEIRLIDKNVSFLIIRVSQFPAPVLRPSEKPFALSE
jgi:hypothetical protein